MATIPNLERRTITPQTRIATVDARGAASLGQAIGAGITEVKDKRDRYQLADAASKFSILKHQQDNAFDEDDKDYGTFDERYSTNMEEGMAEIAEGISDISLRNAFVMDSQPRVAAGRERIKNKAFTVETDVQRGNVNSRLNGMRESILGADEAESTFAINNAKDLIAAAQASGYYGAEEAVNLEKAFTVDAAEGYIRQLAPADRVSALSSSIGGLIPSDTKAVLMREAKDAEMNEAVVGMVDDLPADFTLDQLYSKSSGMEPRLRKKYEAEGASRHQKNKIARRENAEDFHQTEFVPVLLGEKDLDTDAPEFRGLDTDLQNDLIRADKAKNTPRTKSDPWIQDNMFRMNKEKNFTVLRDYFKKNIHKLSASDQAKWSNISLDGVVKKEWESEFSIDQQIESELVRGGTKLNIREKREVRGIIYDWQHTQTEAGKIPTDAEVLNKIKETTGEVDLLDLWGGKHPYFKLDDNQRSELIDETLADPNNEDISEMQFNIVIRDVLENPNDEQQVVDAVKQGLDYQLMLNEDNKSTLTNWLVENDPKAQELIIQVHNLTQQAPSPSQFLEMYESARRLQ